jgi:HTH-type transcriptional regulator/antitoxin HipB
MATIINQLKTIRQALGMKQSELGKKLGLPQSHISRLEQGTTDPRLSTVTDMARILDQELVLVPRQLVSQVLTLLHGQDNRERRWQPDEEGS